MAKFCRIWSHWHFLAVSIYLNFASEFPFQNVHPSQRAQRSGTGFQCRLHLPGCIGRTSSTARPRRLPWSIPASFDVTQKILSVSDATKLNTRRHNNNNCNSSSNCNNNRQPCVHTGDITGRPMQKTVMFKMHTGIEFHGIASFASAIRTHVSYYT